jgi:hypothetical protein
MTPVQRILWERRVGLLRKRRVMLAHRGHLGYELEGRTWALLSPGVLTQTQDWVVINHNIPASDTRHYKEYWAKREADPAYQAECAEWRRQNNERIDRIEAAEEEARRRRRAAEDKKRMLLRVKYQGTQP